MTTNIEDRTYTIAEAVNLALANDGEPVEVLIGHKPDGSPITCYAQDESRHQGGLSVEVGDYDLLDDAGGDDYAGLDEAQHEWFDLYRETFDVSTLSAAEELQPEAVVIVDDRNDDYSHRSGNYVQNTYYIFLKSASDLTAEAARVLRQHYATEVRGTRTVEEWEALFRKDAEGAESDEELRDYIRWAADAAATDADIAALHFGIETPRGGNDSFRTPNMERMHEALVRLGFDRLGYLGHDGEGFNWF